MKTFTLLSCIGTIIIYLLIGFFEWELNAGLWSKDLRAMFVLFTIGWVVIAAMIRGAMEDYKNK
jgi:biotin transporter BioY